jgi:hypothetical protein
MSLKLWFAIFDPAELCLVVAANNVFLQQSIAGLQHNCPGGRDD